MIAAVISLFLVFVGLLGDNGFALISAGLFAIASFDVHINIDIEGKG